MLMEFQRKSDNALQTTEEPRSIPLVQVLHDAEGLTAKRVKIIGTFLVTDDKFGVRSYKISTADEDLPPPSIGDAYSDHEVTFAASFDEEKILNVGQFHNKRVLATGAIYFFPSDSHSTAEVIFMMDGIHEYQPQANANEAAPKAVPGEGMSMLHNQPDDISENQTDPISVIRQAILPQDFDAEGAQAKDAAAQIAIIQINRMLFASFQKNFTRNDPDQLEVGIPAKAFAFQRNDLDAAEQRIEMLNKPLPGEETRKAAVGLWLVAREALEHERTREYGEKLTERALAAAEQQDDPRWAKAIREELEEHDQERTNDASINETAPGSQE